MDSVLGNYLRCSCAARREVQGHRFHISACGLVASSTACGQLNTQPHHNNISHTQQQKPQPQPLLATPTHIKATFFRVEQPTPTNLCHHKQGARHQSQASRLRRRHHKNISVPIYPTGQQGPPCPRGASHLGDILEPPAVHRYMCRDFAWLAAHCIPLLRGLQIAA